MLLWRKVCMVQYFARDTTVGVMTAIYLKNNFTIDSINLLCLTFLGSSWVPLDMSIFRQNQKLKTSIIKILNFKSNVGSYTLYNKLHFVTTAKLRCITIALH